MLQPGDIKLQKPIVNTYMRVGQNSVPAYKFYFTVRDLGQFSVLVPVEGVSASVVEDAIKKVAVPLIAAAESLL